MEILEGSNKEDEESDEDLMLMLKYFEESGKENQK